MTRNSSMQPERMKIQIIVLFQNLGEDNPYYAQSPAPPLPGLLLAALTPPIVDVEVLHEMVRPIDYTTDAECIALSFMDYLAPHAYEVAARFRAMGKTVIGGGKFASTFPEQVQPHFDAILVGEAQQMWPRMVRRPRGRHAPAAVRCAARQLLWRTCHLRGTTWQNPPMPRRSSRKQRAAVRTPAPIAS